MAAIPIGKRVDIGVISGGIGESENPVKGHQLL